MDISVRQLNSEDAPIFHSLRREAIKTDVFVSFFSDIPDENDAPMDRFATLLEPTDTSIFVGAFCDGKLIGYGRVTLTDEGEGKPFEIGSDYVDPTYRRFGVWFLLFDAREAIAREKGCTHLIAHCRIDNIPVQKALHKRGFGIKRIVEGRMCSGKTVKGYEMCRVLLQNKLAPVPPKPGQHGKNDMLLVPG